MTAGELLAAEAESAIERGPADLREVANYVVALEHGVKGLRDLPLSLRLGDVPARRLAASAGATGGSSGARRGIMSRLR